MGEETGVYDRTKVGWTHKAVADKLTEDAKAQINEIYKKVGLNDRIL